MGYLPRVGQRSVVTDDSHWESRRDAVEIPGLAPLIRSYPSHGIERPYSYHIATELSRLLREFGKFPCIHQSMSTMMYGSSFAALSEELISVSDTW